MESANKESSSLAEIIERTIKKGKIQEELGNYIKNSKFIAMGNGKPLEGPALEEAALRQTAIDIPRMGAATQWRINEHIIGRTSQDHNDFIESNEEKQLIYIREHFDKLGVNSEFRDKIIAEFNQGAKCYVALGFYINFIQQQLKEKDINFLVNSAFQRTLFQFEKKDDNRATFTSEIKLIKIEGQTTEDDSASSPLVGDFLTFSNSFDFVYDPNSCEMHIEQVEAHLTPGTDFKLYLKKKEANKLLIEQKNKIYDFEEKSTFAKLWIILNLFNIIGFIQINMKLEKLERAANENLNEILPILGILNPEESFKDHDQIFNSLSSFIEETIQQAPEPMAQPISENLTINVQQQKPKQSASSDSAYDSGYESEDNLGSNTGQANLEEVSLERKDSPKKEILEEAGKALAPDLHEVSEEVSGSSKLL